MEPVRELEFEIAMVTGDCDLPRIEWRSYLRHVIMLSDNRILQQLCWMNEYGAMVEWY